MNKIIIALLTIVTLGFIYYIFPNKDISDYSNNTKTVTDTKLTETVTDKTSDVIIDMKNSLFNPQTITIKKGTKIIWRNSDKFPHTITSDEKGLFDSSSISYGESFSYTFNNTGNINYHCDFHPNMKGVIIVE